MSSNKIPLSWYPSLDTSNAQISLRGGEQARNEAYTLWQLVERVLTNTREQRVAYLLFHCALTPNEIVQRCALEFPDIQEVHSLRCAIMKKLISIV